MTKIKHSENLTDKIFVIRTFPDLRYKYIFGAIHCSVNVLKFFYVCVNIPHVIFLPTYVHV